MVLPLLVVGVSHVSEAQQQERWSWQGGLTVGKTVEVKGVLSSIRAVPSDGDQIEVIAKKHSRRGETSVVQMRVLEHAGGVTICALYPTPAHIAPNVCVAGDEGHGGGRMGNFETDVRVDFLVRMPKHLTFAARTLVGDVEARQLVGDVTASTGVGNIAVATLGTVSARSVNGSIRASMGASRLRQDLKLSTMGGDITLDLPASLNADFALDAGGSIEAKVSMTGFPNSVSHQLRGRLGSGGRIIMVSASGNIFLRQSPPPGRGP
ncbi:MAG: hypothetical protein V4617_07985 [Gemmatimonadota bacterium]